MKDVFVIEQKPLFGILSAMQPICSKRTTLDTTSYILFHVGHKELVLKSTDLEISLQSNCALKESNHTTPVSFLVSGRRIFELVKELEGDITCVLAKNQLKLKAGNVDVSLNIKDAQEFPSFPERIENLMHIDAPFLLAMLNKVAFLIPQSNANPALNGLLLEVNKHQLKMTATDGHCLAQVTSDKYTLAEAKQWLLPRRAIFELKKLLESCEDKNVFAGMCGSQLVFSGSTFNFFTKLLVDPFPQYDPILDRTGFLAASVDRSHLIKTLRRSSCMLSGQFIATQFTFNESALKVSMQNKEVGKLEEDLAITGFSGTDLDIRFYAPYLLNGLQVFNEENVAFHLSNTSKPIVFESSGKEYNLVYLVMPVSPQQQSG